MNSFNDKNARNKKRKPGYDSDNFGNTGNYGAGYSGNQHGAYNKGTHGYQNDNWNSWNQSGGYNQSQQNRGYRSQNHGQNRQSGQLYGEHRYKDMLANLPCGVLETDFHGAVRFTNETIKKMTGFSHADFRNKGAKVMFSSTGEMRSFYDKMIRSDSFSNTPVAIRKKTGETRTFISYGTIKRDSRGGIERIQIIMVDPESDLSSLDWKSGKPPQNSRYGSKEKTGQQRNRDDADTAKDAAKTGVSFQIRAQGIPLDKSGLIDSLDKYLRDRMRRYGDFGADFDRVTMLLGNVMMEQSGKPLSAARISELFESQLAQNNAASAKGKNKNQDSSSGTSGYSAELAKVAWLLADFVSMETALLNGQDEKPARLADILETAGKLAASAPFGSDNHKSKLQTEFMEGTNEGNIELACNPELLARVLAQVAAIVSSKSQNTGITLKTVRHEEGTLKLSIIFDGESADFDKYRSALEKIGSDNSAIEPTDSYYAGLCSFMAAIFKVKPVFRPIDANSGEMPGLDFLIPIGSAVA